MGFFDNIFSKESKTKLEFYQMENKILIGGPGAVVIVVVVVVVVVVTVYPLECWNIICLTLLFTSCINTGKYYVVAHPLPVECDESWNIICLSLFRALHVVGKLLEMFAVLVGSSLML